MTTQECAVIANPDIAGIGVRCSIYAQSLLSFAPPLIYVSDGVMDSDEEALLQTIYSALLLTSFALLISAFIQAGTLGLSAYHALIVLNLSWIVNIAALIVCVFPTIKRKTKGQSGWKAWALNLLPTRLRQLLATILVIIHLCATGALGIWVWSTGGAFGSLPASQDCVATTIMTLFTYDIHVTNERMRITSLFLYAIAAFPVVNAFTFTAFIVASSLALDLFIGMITGGKTDSESDTDTSYLRQVGSLYFAAVVIQLFLTLRTIVDTELMIHRTLRSPGESDWTFGQTLALLVVVFPFLGVVVEVFRTRGMKWWLRKLLRQSSQEWSAHFNNMERPVTQALNCLEALLRQFTDADTDNHQPELAHTHTKSALERMKVILCAIKKAIDTADAIVKNAINTAVADAVVKTANESCHTELGQRKKFDWEKFRLEMENHIATGREAVVAARSVRIPNLKPNKERICFDVGGATLQTAQMYFDSVKAALNEATVAYQYLGSSLEFAPCIADDVKEPFRDGHIA